MQSIRFGDVFYCYQGATSAALEWNTLLRSKPISHCAMCGINFDLFFHEVCPKCGHKSRFFCTVGIMRFGDKIIAVAEPRELISEVIRTRDAYNLLPLEFFKASST